VGVNSSDLKEMARVAFGMMQAGRLGLPVPKSINDFAHILQEELPEFFELAKGLGTSAFTEEVAQTHMLMRWLGFGLPVFEITHSLLASLILTDPGNVAAEEVRPPFETFAVRLPGDFWEVVCTAEPVLDEVTSPAFNGVVRKRVGSREIDPFAVPLSTMWVHHQDAKSKMMLRLIGSNGVTLWERLPGLDELESVAEWLVHSPGPIEKQSGYFMNVMDRDVHLQRAARRLYVNMCLYIAERGKGELKRTASYLARKNRRKPKKPMKPQPEVWVIGKEVKLNKELIGAAKDWTDAQRKVRNRWRISKRFTVRGHWRMQACGPGRKDRRRRWIEPFWKGPKEGAKLTHLYQAT
jgi:hypothetical protein